MAAPPHPNPEADPDSSSGLEPKSLRVQPCPRSTKSSVLTLVRQWLHRRDCARRHAVPGVRRKDQTRAARYRRMKLRWTTGGEAVENCIDRGLRSYGAGNLQDRAVSCAVSC